MCRTTGCGLAEGRRRRLILCLESQREELKEFGALLENVTVV